MARLFAITCAVALAGASLAWSFAPMPAAADETGLASIHTWRKVGRKTCFVDHEHNGVGSGATKKVAEMQAIRSWQSFTALEYGSDWANFTNAVGKRISCEGSGSSVQCSLDAIPCRPY